jgi:hypothetical protein
MLKGWILEKIPIWASLSLFLLLVLAIKEDLSQNSRTLPDYYIWFGLSEKSYKKSIWENRFFSTGEI